MWRKLFCVVVVFALFSQASLAHTDDPKAIIRQVYAEIFNQGNFDLLEELYAPDYANRGYSEDVASLEANISAMRTALPDFEATIEVLIAQDEYAASRVIYNGTFTEEWVMGDKTIPPTDEEIAWTSIIIYRFNEDGQIAEEFTAYDQLDLLLQLEDEVLPPVFLAFVTPREIAPAIMEEDIVYDDALTEKSIAFFTAVIEDAINNGELDVISNSMSDEYRTHEPFGDFTTQQFRDVIGAFRSIVPDLHVETNILITENNWLATRLIYRGTFANEIPLGILSIEPTQKPIEFVINVLVHFDENGVGLEDFKEYNRLGWLRQLGILDIEG